MYIGFKHLHSFVAYIALAGLAIAVVRAFAALARKRPYDRRFAVLGLASCHLQAVAGLVLYFISPMGSANLSGQAMADSTQRLYAVEHPLAMLLAVVLVTIGYSKAKRSADDRRRNRLVFRYYLIGLVLIVLRIPWSAWF